MNNAYLFGDNVKKWLWEDGRLTDDERETKLNVMTGLITAPIGGEAVLGTKAGLGALKALTPFVGNKIAQGIVASGASGAIGGGAEGLMRGISSDNENPLQTALSDAATGTVSGLALGYGFGKLGKAFARKALKGADSAKIKSYFDDYVDGLYQSDKVGGLDLKAKAMADMRAARNGWKPNKMQKALDEADDFVDLTNAFNNPKLNLTNSLQDAKDFINEANINGTVFETASPDFILDMAGNSKQKNHILKSDKVKKMSDIDKLNHNVIMSNFNEVSKGLKPTTNKPSPNTKLSKKPKVENYYYFEGNVKKGDDIIPIVADAEQNFGDELTSPQKLHLYNLYDKKFSPILNDKTSVNFGENTNSISQYDKNLNTKLYNNITNNNKFDDDVIINWDNPYHSRWKGINDKGNYVKSKSRYYENQKYRDWDFSIRVSDHNKALKGGGQWSDDNYNILDFDGIKVKIDKDFYDGNDLDIVVDKIGDFNKIKSKLNKYLKEQIPLIYYEKLHKVRPNLWH